MKMTATLAAAASALLLAADWAQATERAKAESNQAQIARGRYLIKTAGCNDCHTPGYMPANGKIDEKLWLTGDGIGFRGGWGTTYPSNLRIYFANVSDEAWIKDARSGRMRPPMPWFNLAAMTNADLRAISAYVRSLGVAGSAAPAALAPGEEPRTPYFVFEPQAPKAVAAAR